MKSMRRFNKAGMILSMVIGMIIAACMSPAAGPEIVESDEAAAPVMQEEMQTTLSIVQDRANWSASATHFCPASVSLIPKATSPDLTSITAVRLLQQSLAIPTPSR